MEKNKSDLQKKLKSYSVLAGAAIAVSNSASAQIVYTDVAPDSTITAGGFYNLDLNNDGITDFKLEQRSGTYYGFPYYAVLVTPEYITNAVDTLGSEAAHAVDIGFMVDSTLNWVDSTVMASQFPPTASALAAVVPSFLNAGNFLGTTGKFLPLRFNIEGDNYFGWVRVDVAADALSFKVIDYAYKNAPMGPCETGLQSDASVHESFLSNQVEIFSYDKSINVRLENGVALEGIISVTNLLGQEVQTVAVTNHQLVIPMEQAKPGIYLVTIKQENDIFTKRVSIK